MHPSVWLQKALSMEGLKSFEIDLAFPVSGLNIYACVSYSLGIVPFGTF